MTPSRRAQLSGPAVVLGAVVALFAGISVLRFTSPDAGLGIGFLFVVPIVLLAVRFRVAGAIAGVCVSLVLTLIWDVAKDIHLTFAGYAVRATVFVFGGGAAAFFARVGTRLERESVAWFDGSADLNCVANADGYFLRVNDAFVKTLGYSKDELLATPFIDFVHPEDRDKTIAETIKLAERLGDTVDFENRYLARDGSYRWLQWSATTADNGRIYASARDVTTQKKLEAELREHATTDSLTGLPNRRHFEEQARRALAHVRRYGSTAAVLMIDLDGFKAVNDRIGHHAGDAVLQCVGEKLQSRLRESDLVARMGGDEFVVLLPEADEARAAVVAQTLLERIETCSWRGNDVEMAIAGSVGIAVLDPSSGNDLRELLRAADEAMLEAKRAGGSRLGFASRQQANRVE